MGNQMGQPQRQPQGQQRQPQKMYNNQSCMPGTDLCQNLVNQNYCNTNPSWMNCACGDVCNNPLQPLRQLVNGNGSNSIEGFNGDAGANASMVLLFIVIIVVIFWLLMR